MMAELQQINQKQHQYSRQQREVFSVIPHDAWTLMKNGSHHQCFFEKRKTLEKPNLKSLLKKRLVFENQIWVWELVHLGKVLGTPQRPTN